MDRRNECGGAHAHPGGECTPGASDPYEAEPLSAVLAFSGEVLREVLGLRAARPAGALLAKRIGEFLHAQQVSLFLAGESENWLTCEALWCAWPHLTASPGLLPTLAPDACPLLEVLGKDRRARVAVPDDLLCLAEASRTAMRLDETGSLLLIPLCAGPRLAGLILVQRETGRPVFRPEESVPWSVFGAQAGWVVDGWRHLEARDIGFRHYKEVLELSQIISSTQDLRRVPELVTRRAMELCEADEATLFLLDADGTHLTGAHSVGEYAAEVLSLRIAVGEGITGTVAASRKGEIVNQAEQDPRSRHIPGTPLDPEAILAAPLISADRLIGVLTLHKLEGRTFKPLDLDSVEILCTQAAVSLESARQGAARNEERLRLVTMMQQMHEGVVFAGRDRRVLLINASARRLLGIADRDWSDSPLETILQGEEMGRILSTLDRIRETQSLGDTLELHLGTETILCSISRVVAGEEVLGDVILFHDVSDLKEVEAQVLQSSKMSAVGQLAAGVAHEFNNLIAAIYGYAQFMEENQSPELVKKGVDVILRSSERAKELTSSLLTFSRRKPGRREPMQVEAILQDALLLLNREFEKARIRVHLEVPAFPSTVADAGQIQQVVLNILINALQAMEGGGNLWIRGSAGPELLELSFEDDGPGIPEAHLNRVFEPFFTTKGSLSGSAMAGSGLGLSAAYNILKDHGGTLRVASPPGKGAVFTFALPVRRHLAGPTESARSLPPGLRGTGRILIADSDAALVRSMRDALAGLGQAVVGCDSEDELMNRAGEADLIFLDVAYAGRDQVAFVRRLRGNRTGQPVVFLTRRDGDDRIEVEGDPWVFRLARPFRSRDLVALTSRILALRFRRAS